MFQHCLTSTSGWYSVKALQHYDVTTKENLNIRMLQRKDITTFWCSTLTNFNIWMLRRKNDTTSDVKILQLHDV